MGERERDEWSEPNLRRGVREREKRARERESERARERERRERVRREKERVRERERKHLKPDRRQPLDPAQLGPGLPPHRAALHLPSHRMLDRPGPAAPPGPLRPQPSGTNHGDLDLCLM
jgi:hypothetical protein